MIPSGRESCCGNSTSRTSRDNGSDVWPTTVAAGVVLDWQLQHRPVSFPVARSFVRRHHAHCNPPVTWRFGQSVFNGHTMLGVIMVGNPVAPALNGRGILEVNRLCIRRDLPRALAWNAASMLYGWGAREAERRGWTHIVTYTRADEDGTSLRAAGWVQESPRSRQRVAFNPPPALKHEWLDRQNQMGQGSSPPHTPAKIGAEACWPA